MYVCIFDGMARGKISGGSSDRCKCRCWVEQFVGKVQGLSAVRKLFPLVTLTLLLNLSESGGKSLMINNIQ